MRKYILLLLSAAVLLASGCTAEPVEPAVLTPNGGEILLDAAALRPEDGVWALGGSEVYFGEYDGTPALWRVLESVGTQTIQNDGGLLLDCEPILFRKAYDDDFWKNEGQEQPHEWCGSDLELLLNGDEFLNSAFSTVERAAIAQTTLAEESTFYSAGDWVEKYHDFAATDRVFLLSAAEARDLYADDAARLKEGSSTSWWLRSAFDKGGNGAASVHGDGHICNYSITNFTVGVSPALNVKASSILFASSVAGEEPTRKLTLLDASKSVELSRWRRVTRSDTEKGVTVTVPYTCGGDDVSRISVMITDRDYMDDDAQVLYHGAVESDLGDKNTGTGAFILPAELCGQVCGEDYYAYLLAVDVNGPHQTDYASGFCEITIPAED